MWRPIAVGLLALVLLTDCASNNDSTNLARSACLAWPARENGLQNGDPYSEVSRAYYILVNCYVDPPDKELLLRAAWQGGRSALVGAGLAAPQAPAFSGKPDPDEIVMVDALHRLAALGGTQIKDSQVIEGAIAEMAASLRDDHTGYLPPEYWQRSLRSGSSLVADIGTSSVSRPDGQLVWEVVKDGAADRAGVHIGDLIVAFNGKSIAQGSKERIEPAQLGVPVDLTMMRGGQEMDFELTPLPQRPILTTRLLEGDIAYVRLSTFLTTPERYLATYSGLLAELQAQNPAGWILDLRNNSGGRFDVASDVAGQFGLTGQFEIQRGGAGQKRTVTPSTQSITEGKPVAILVNERSASASEILAAAFQDGHFARLIGSTTAGNVNANADWIVAGGGLSVTIARVFAGKNGRALDGVGVVPDVTVDISQGDLMAGRDGQVSSAIDYIRAEARRLH